MLEGNILGANCNHKIDGLQLLNIKRARPERNRQERDQISEVRDQKLTEPQIARPRSLIREIRVILGGGTGQKA
jgi:hypothetical protein